MAALVWDRHHTSQLDREADAARHRARRAAGFEVIRISEDILRWQPAELVRIVSNALQIAA